jgi:selenocysteine lyase/cysteine desulfurase
MFSTLFVSIACPVLCPVLSYFLYSIISCSPQLCRLNNGSFGACPAVVLEAQRKLQAEWLHNPDDFWHSLSSRFLAVQQTLAADLFQRQVRAEDLAVVDNLTAAVAVIVHSVVANITTPRSVIVLSSLTYDAVRNAISYGISQARIKSGVAISVLTVDIPFPLVAEDPEAALLDAYRDALASLPPESHIALACLDHISSLPCLRFPVRALVRLLREHGAREVLVDGAHGPGQLDVAQEVPLMGADYYVANLHKVSPVDLPAPLLASFATHLLLLLSCLVAVDVHALRRGLPVVLALRALPRLSAPPHRVAQLLSPARGRCEWGGGV